MKETKFKEEPTSKEETKDDKSNKNTEELNDIIKKEDNSDKKIKNSSDIENKQKESRGKSALNIFLSVLCYVQVGLSALWIIYSLIAGYTMSFVLWLLVLIIFLPFVKKIIVNKCPKLKSFIIPARVVLLILAFFVMVFSTDSSYEGTWKSDNGMNVIFESSVSTITLEDGKTVKGTYEVTINGNNIYGIAVTGNDGIMYNFIYNYGDENKTLCYQINNECVKYFNKEDSNK